MITKCFSCGENGVLYNSEQRCDVCFYCGVVNDSSPLAEPESAGVEQACLPTHSATKFKIGKNGARQAISTHTSNASGTSGTTTKTGQLGRECLERLMASYGVPSSTLDQALQLYWDNLRKRFQHREARALAGAVFMTVLRKEKRIVSFKEVAEFCETPVKLIGRQFKNVQQDLIARGQVVGQQPSLNETVQFSIDFYASKLRCDELLDISEVVKKSMSLVDWIDACTVVQQWPPHLFALSVFYLSFKAVNISNSFHLELKDFNKTYDLCPEKVLSIPTFNRVSPKSLVQEIMDKVNKLSAIGHALAVTHESFFFLFDMIISMKPIFEHKVPLELLTTENDEAYKRFLDEKRAQELRELQTESESDSLDVIEESEINEYILSHTEVEMKQRLSMGPGGSKS